MNTFTIFFKTVFSQVKAVAILLLGTILLLIGIWCLVGTVYLMFSVPWTEDWKGSLVLLLLLPLTLFSCVFFIDKGLGAIRSIQFRNGPWHIKPGLTFRDMVAFRIPGDTPDGLRSKRLGRIMSQIAGSVVVGVALILTGSWLWNLYTQHQAHDRLVGRLAELQTRIEKQALAGGTLNDAGRGISIPAADHDQLGLNFALVGRNGVIMWRDAFGERNVAVLVPQWVDGTLHWRCFGHGNTIAKNCPLGTNQGGS